MLAALSKEETSEELRVLIDKKAANIMGHAETIIRYFFLGKSMSVISPTRVLCLVLSCFGLVCFVLSCLVNVLWLSCLLSSRLVVILSCLFAF